MISYSIDIPSLITVSIYSEAGFINQQTSSYVVIDRSIVSIVDKTNSYSLWLYDILYLYNWL